jgi:N-acetylglucosamine-6-phosphate deacetylase
MLCIKNAALYTPNPAFQPGSVLIDGGRIATIGLSDTLETPTDAEIIDAAGYVLAPGFIDLQLNGGFGHDFTQNPDTIWQVGTQLPQQGVTAFLPTLITSPLETIRHAQQVLDLGAPSDYAGAVPVGLHLEGPFLNPAKKGAHNRDYIRPPSVKDISDWSADSHVGLVTLAPEMPGAHDLIRCLSKRGVTVSVGHSNSTYDEGVAGIEAGVRYATHLFNAMPQIHHREPGIIGAVLADERLTIGLIPDGIHVHPALVKLVIQAVGIQRINVVTDAMAALGMPPDIYHLGDFKVTVSADRAQLTDGTLAGSILPMDQALRNLMSFAGCTLADALITITRTPADLLNVRKGRIAPGYDADFVLLAHDNTVEAAYVAGKLVYTRGRIRTSQ